MLFCCLVSKSYLTLCDPMNCSTPGFSVPHNLLDFMSIESLMSSQLSHPLLPFSSSAFNLSQHNEYSGLISFKMNWFDFLALQGTVKSLLQHHSSNVSILQCSAFFMVQLSHQYLITGKTMALTILTFCWQSDVFAF